MSVRVLTNRIVLGWIILVLIVALFGGFSVAEAGDGRTAADFLLVGVGARAAGMSGAFTAVSEGAAASYWNPAGLTGTRGGELMLGHFAWYQDITIEQGTIAYQLSEVSSLAASITYLNYGQIDGYDYNGSFTNEITAYDWSGALSFAFKANENISVGLTAKFINQKLDDLNGSTFAADVGLKYSSETFAVAAFVGNIGPDIKFDNVSEDLPSLARVGISALPLNESFLTSVEFEKRFHGGSVMRQGFEYNFNEMYFVRTGYNFYPNEDERSFGNGMTLGVGLKLSGAEFDYSYTPEDSYSSEDLHRLSVLLRFGN